MEKEEIRFRMSKQGNEDSYFNPYADLQILFKKAEKWCSQINLCHQKKSKILIHR